MPDEEKPKRQTRRRRKRNKEADNGFSLKSKTKK